MKIHYRCCHGLSASSESHRRMVAREIDPQIPSLIACSASPAPDHRDSGTPLSRGGVQAIALTRATCTTVNFGRRTRRRPRYPLRPLPGRPDRLEMTPCELTSETTKRQKEQVELPGRYAKAAGR